ncbi:MAG: hypothetical protein DWQ42_01300 [Planctomycetota bacterium]|nr:MAG: hypothetical protein DWQ42_01300 [Planctomycetota bacterium]REK38215.1 MAG: hypothetical protein DWQ46_21035 [Planctomycetota bacterium]
MNDSPASSGVAPDTPATSVRLRPAFAVVVVAAAVIVALFRLPLDEPIEGWQIEGWQRVVFSGVVLITAGVALLIWLFRHSGIPVRWSLRIVAVGIALVVLAFATLRVRYDGNMRPIVGWNDWVLSLFGLMPTATEGPWGELAERERRGRELAAAGDRARDSLGFLGSSRRPEYELQLVADWQAHPPEELWRRPAGEAFSSFAVVGDLAVTQEQFGEEETTVAFELASGEVLWNHADTARFASGLGGNGPRATPTIEGERVYVMGATGLLTCLNLFTGELIWQRNVIEDNAASVPQWGMSGSPLIVGDNVVVAGGDQGDGAAAGEAAGSGRPHAVLLAYDKQTGKPAWRGEDAEDASYGSPQLATVAGRPQILIFTASKIVGHDAATGAQLWSHPWPGNMPNVAQVVALDERRVFAAKGYATGSVVLEIVDNGAGGMQVEEVWRDRKLMKTKFTNAAIRGDYAYGLSDGQLECVDLAKGKRVWKVRSDYGHGQVVLVGEHLLIQAESGDVALVKATTEGHEEVARFSPLSDRTWNYPVLVGDRLLVRNDQEMACYRVQLAE